MTAERYEYDDYPIPLTEAEAEDFGGPNCWCVHVDGDRNGGGDYGCCEHTNRGGCCCRDTARRELMRRRRCDFYSEGVFA